MKPLVSSFLSGALFAVGLMVSGMTRPAKITGFLDVAGAWDASLAFEMVGAIGAHFVLQRLIRRRERSLFEAGFCVPDRRDTDARLVIGAAIFGIGWGLAGYCPGPALVAAGTGRLTATVFVAGMTLGMFLEQLTRSRSKPSSAEPATT
jgi:uncharacterized membrane protein YedE/YeeE